MHEVQGPNNSRSSFRSWIIDQTEVVSSITALMIHLNPVTLSSLYQKPTRSRDRSESNQNPNFMVKKDKTRLETQNNDKSNPTPALKPTGARN